MSVPTERGNGMTLKTLRLSMAHATESGKRAKLADIRPELGVVQFRIWQAEAMAVITQAAHANERRN